ncbi:TetR/AcrR family transcriptional regulator [Serpentinicella sp. ANB-PHB4]|uniref:TetR/AcrR family transcriptional regulator n=1 Tax=Serpentinicella sp. ANB-PHB4 TaxID=3074076 RepID=UPI00285B07FD|nr:TetR/AcrR family transcriptional regulator [Serpentinicella sp. ANB-PHB4]MDR5658859.1 TetR/AcrR family transcriptional regulator [Serpentinicella sp. ANB-PHB4]
MGKQSQLKFKRLLEKAEELFIDRGYSKVTIDQIALAAGISKVTLYKHFNSKEDLFIHIMKNITTKHYDVLQSQLTDIKGSVEKLNFLFKYSLESYKKYPLTFYKDMMETPSIWEKIYNYRKERAIKICKDILKEGINSNEIRELNINHTVSILLCLGESLPKMFPFNDYEESKLFMDSYYNFVNNALIKK